MKNALTQFVIARNEREIPVSIKPYAAADSILKKIQYAIDHIQPQEKLDQVTEIRHFGGCSNHAREMKLSHAPSVFLRVPGDHPQILEDRGGMRTESVFVNRAIENITLCVLDECGVNGVLNSEPCIQQDFYFFEREMHAGYKVESFIPGAQTLEGLFTDIQLRRGALRVLSRLHAVDVLNIWVSHLRQEQIVTYDIVLRIQMMLEGMDAIVDTMNIQEKLVKNIFRVIDGVDIYGDGRTGMHVSETPSGLRYTVLPKRKEISVMLEMYEALRAALHANLDEDDKRLCHNDLSSANYLVSKKKLESREMQITDKDIMMIDFEFAAKNDPMCDLAYLISEEKALFSEARIIDLLREYHAAEEVSAQQFEQELDRIAFYLPLIDLKVAIWSSYQVLLNNESSSLKGLTQTWGIGRWQAFMDALNHPWIRLRFAKNDMLSKLDAIQDFALAHSQIVQLGSNQKFSWFNQNQGNSHVENKPRPSF